MQDLVDAGVFDLNGERLGGADLDRAAIAAEIDGHEVYVQFIGSSEGAREVRR